MAKSSMFATFLDLQEMTNPSADILPFGHRWGPRLHSAQENSIVVLQPFEAGSVKTPKKRSRSQEPCPSTR
jgi:hypothetical protein